MDLRPDDAFADAGGSSDPPTPSLPHTLAEARWRRCFEDVRGSHRSVQEIDVSQPGERYRRQPGLGRSLATFQLGESGTGEHLLRAAADAGVSADHLAALRCFVVEEQEHARLLGLVLDGLEVPWRDHHWSDAVFVALRRAHSLRAEVLTLLVAEVIALTYYGALRDGIGHPSLRDVFGRIHDDEVRHVDFHAETLPPYLRRFSPSGQHLARVLWNTLVAGAAVVAALDHGGALAGVGMTRRQFVRRVHSDRRELSRRLFSGCVGRANAGPHAAALKATCSVSSPVPPLDHAGVEATRRPNVDGADLVAGQP